MKRTIFGLMITVAAVVVAVTWSKGVSATNLKLHAKDLPKHGLKIITPSDP